MPTPITEFLRTFDRAALAPTLAAATAKRAELVRRFPKSEWPALTLERYALGTEKSRDSFCYALEYGSDELGNMSGGAAGKSLIFFKREDQAWKFDTASYPNVEKAWATVRAAFVESIRLGEAGKFTDVDLIPALRGARVLRTKFLSVYFPQAILPVFSRTHLAHFLEALDEEITEDDSRKTITLGLRLSRKLREQPQLRDWANDELMALLYQWNPPASESKLVKIAPGEGARFWDSDCLPQGMICVGWESVGDLRKFDNFADFRKAFEEDYLEEFNGSQSTVTRKAKEVWLLRDLEEGDLIAANRGTKEILAVGEVVSPGYVWDGDRKEFNHTVKVRWDLTRGGVIEPVKKWVNITVDNVTGELRKTILGLHRDVPLPAPSKAISHESLPLAVPMNPTNLILYGPPGTGKTYALQQLQSKYTELPRAQDRSVWLQALVAGYGWRAVVAAALDINGPSPVPKIRDHELLQAKAVSNQRERNLSPTIWASLQQHTPESVPTVQFGTRRPPFIFTKSPESVWSLLPDWADNDEDAATLAKLYRDGPLANSPAVRRFRQVTFHPSFSYEDFIRGIRPVATSEDDRTEFRMVDGVFKQICDEARANPTKRYALFIDEINRGNIAKIFGELITLIEPDKRLTLHPDGTMKSGIVVQLPGGGGGDVAEPPFGVPTNLDLYGTMNTADRSIALLDIALRRRFEFKEMEPNYDLLATPAGGINRAALLKRINDRLEYLLDRDHRIGHAYLMKATGLEEMQTTFANQIIPLLQEYFFDDLAKVALTLSGTTGSNAFVGQETLHRDTLFPSAGRKISSTSRERYIVKIPANWTEADFMSIYAPSGQAVAAEAEES